MKNRDKKDNQNSEVTPRDQVTDGADKRAMPETMTADGAGIPHIAETTDGGQKERNTLLKVLTYVLPFLLFCGYACFSVLSKRTSIIELAADGASILFFAMLIVSILPRFLRFFSEEESPSTELKIGERSRRFIHPTAKSILYSLLAQICVIVTVYIADGLRNGFNETVFAAYSRLFIASHGIEFAGNTRTLASSLGALSFILPEYIERAVAGMALVYPIFAVNTLAVSASAVLMYELTLLDFDKKSSRFAEILLFVSPTVILLMQPLSGTSLFFVFTLLSLLLARKHRFVWSGVCAVIASLFNIFAGLLFVPIMLEGLRRCIRIKRNQESVDSKLGVSITSCVIGTALPLVSSAGAIVYWQMTGKGLNALSGVNRLFFEPLGRIITTMYSGMTIYNAEKPLYIIALVLLALLALVSLKKLRTSYAVFSLLLIALTPSVLWVRLTLYSVFALPLLPMMESSVLSRKYLRSIYTALMLIVTVLFIVFLFVRRIA